MLQDPRY
jgi:ribA/ribD-fused uncharacterized protein